MKLTKYTQSCFLIEAEGKKILIDPGVYVDEETIKGFRDIDIILFTHIHDDHCFLSYTEIILKNNHPLIFGNDEVVKKLNGFDVSLVKEGDLKDIDNLKIEVVKAVHGYNPSLGEKKLPVSVGFIVRDNSTSVYHCGDSLAFPHSFKSEIILVPACGFGWVMEPEVAVDFCLAMGCRLAIPIHYDSPKQQMLNGKERFTKYAAEKGLNYKVLDDGESVEV